MIRRVRNEILEEYDPMPASYWRRNKKPNIDLLSDSPFASDRQLEDQRFLMMKNRNPRGMEAGKNDKPRSLKISAKGGVNSAAGTKAKVLNKIVREASGVHNYALVAPIRNKAAEGKMEIDPETHPLMKPYREQSNRNPVMVSFGHRPKSASRTFHPGTMRVRLGKGEIADTTAAEGKNGIGLPPSVLAQILHAPRVPRPGEELQELEAADVCQDRPDPNDLFLSEEQLFGSGTKSRSAPMNGRQRSLTKSSSWQEGLIGGESGSADDMLVGEDGFGRSVDQRGHLRRKFKPPKKKAPPVENREEWVRDFHIMEKRSNEVFELRKSGIAETKLMPLKDRLARFAAISVREQKPDPFCVEKKVTDLLVANGKPAKEVPAGYDRTANPFYDAEVEDDLRTIRNTSQIRAEQHEKKLREKLLKAALASVPAVSYHPDQIVIARAGVSTGEDSPQLQEIPGGLLEASSSLAVPGAPGTSLRQSPSKKKGAKKLTADVPFAVYLSNSPGKAKTKKKGSSGSPKNKKAIGSKTTANFSGSRTDGVYSHVMQPFDKYMQREEEEAARLHAAEEEHRQKEECRRWQGEYDEEEDVDDRRVSELDRLGMELGGDLSSTSLYQAGEVDRELAFDEDAALENAGHVFDGQDDVNIDEDVKYED